MLKQNNEKCFKQERLYEAALKHKVRNLRAKVQSLLPINFCQKIDKRNKRLKKQYSRHQQMQFQKISQKSLHNAQPFSQWKYSYNMNRILLPFISKAVDEYSFQQNLNTQSNHNYNCKVKQDNFIDHNTLFKDRTNQQGKSKTRNINSLKGYHFQKLTQDQIEQIQQDKLYYLVDQRHIKAYQTFLKQKYAIKSTIPISNEVYNSVSRTTIPFGSNKNLKSAHKIGTNISFQSKNFNQHHPQTLLKHRKELKNQIKNHLNQNRNKNDSLPSNSVFSHNRFFRNTTNDKLNNSNVQQNLMRINQQQQIKRILLSMELKTKQQKVQQNFIKIQNSRIEEIRKQNRQKGMKIYTAQSKKRKIYNQAGQITQLTQKLRKRCIQRKTFRPRQIQFQPQSQDY